MRILENDVMRDATPEELMQFKLIDEQAERDAINSRQVSEREIRNRLLAESDWVEFPTSPLTDEKRAAWRVYRQALRDVTTQVGFPLEIQWPVKPS